MTRKNYSKIWVGPSPSMPEEGQGQTPRREETCLAWGSRDMGTPLPGGQGVWRQHSLYERWSPAPGGHTGEPVPDPQILKDLLAAV